MKHLSVILILFLTLTSCAKKASQKASIAQSPYISAQGYSIDNGTIKVPQSQLFNFSPVSTATGNKFVIVGLPSNELHYDANTGEISGTPTTVAVYPISITRLNGNVITATMKYNIEVVNVQPPSNLIYPFESYSIPKNQNYTISPTSYNGNFLTFTATNLPSGFSINAKTGVITGSYSGAGGTYHPTITLSNPIGWVSESLSFIFACNSGYTNVSGSCVIATNTRTCLTQPLNSSGGVESSTDGGISYGSCTGFTCNSSYTNIAGTCVLESQTRSCLSQPLNSTGGTEATIDGGLNWSSCSSYTCNASFTNVSGSCVLSTQTRACISQPANSTGGLETSTNGGVTWGACSSYTCNSSYTNISGVCTLSNQSRACLTQPIHSSGGTEITTDGGQTWSSCSSYTCNASYTNVSGTCLLSSQTRACISQPANSTGGTETSSDGGQTWNSCSSFTCNATYTNVGGSCVLSSQTRVCSSQPLNSNGGNEVSSDGGQTFGSCTGYSCDSSYTNVSGVCTLSSQSRACVSQPANSTGGTETSSDGGQTWSSCSSFTCNTTYTNVSGSCVLSSQSRVCSSQPSNSTGGTESSSDGGQTFGSCSGYTCDSSYTNISGVCTLSNQTRTCISQPSHSNGGTEATSDGGQSWGACTGYSCDSSYTNVAGVCNLSNQSRVCSSQPSNSAGGTESSSDGGQTWSSCSSFTCNTGYSVSGSSCAINSYSVTVNKLTNQASVEDITLGLLSASLVSTSVNHSYNYGQMLVLEATPASGYSITGWTGCDSVSNDFLRCTISSLNANTTVVPVMVASYHTLSVALSNTSLNSYAPIYVEKNGSSCDSTCQSQLLSGDLIKVTVTPDAYLNNVSSFSFTGTHSNDDTSTVNAVSFTMGSSNVSITANITEKDVVISNEANLGVFYDGSTSTELTYFINTSGLTAHAFYSTSGSVRLAFVNTDVNLSNDRSIEIYSDGICSTKIGTLNSTGSTSRIYQAITYTSNGTDTYSFKAFNVNKSSACYVRVGHHLTSITKSTETFVLNSSVEGSNGYKSFFTDGSNTVSGNCLDLSNTGNPANTNYNYGYLQIFSDAVKITAKAYMNTDLTTPFYSQTQSVGCYSGAYDLTFSQNANFATADVIKYFVTLTNFFGAHYTETITVNKEKTSKSCVISNGTGTQSYVSNGSYSTCTVSSCDATYTQSGNTCVLTTQNRACSPQPANSTGGTQTSTDGGVTWSACSSFTCTSGNILTADTLSCEPRIQARMSNFSTGSAGSCAINSAGKAYCWGYNLYGTIGNGNNTDSLIPVAVDTTGVLSGKTVKQISMGASHACAIASDNKAYCWGDNSNGQLGNNSITESNVPVAVDTTGVLSGKTILQISAAYDYTCAIASDKLVYCWGLNSQGNLGNNSTVESHVPVAVDTTGVLSGKTILQIATNQYTVCAIASDYLPYCWGKNGTSGTYYGILGNNTTVSMRSYPVAVTVSGVLSGKTLRQISGNSSNTFCVIDNTNKAHCWGDGGDGNLGNNTWVASKVPVTVSTSGVLSGKNIKSIAIGSNHVCAFTTTNTVSCWGRGTSGQMGDGNATASPTPVNTKMSGSLSGLTVSDIAAGWHNSCVSTSNGKLFCWGWNNDGHAGDGTSNQHNTPSQGLSSVLSL